MRKTDRRIVEYYIQMTFTTTCMLFPLPLLPSRVFIIIIVINFGNTKMNVEGLNVHTLHILIKINKLSKSIFNGFKSFSLSLFPLPPPEVYIKNMFVANCPSLSNTGLDFV